MIFVHPLGQCEFPSVPHIDIPMLLYRVRGEEGVRRGAEAA